MKRSGIVTGLIVGVFLVGCNAEVAGDAAARAGDGGESHGFGSEAFRERHASLVLKFEEKGHPVFDEHPAVRVHRALANGERPMKFGKEQAASRRMAEARR